MEELQRFAQGTSMKGMPRIVHGDTRFLRLLWTVALFGFLSISLYQTTVLVCDFLLFDHVTQVSEVVWDPHSTGGTLPDINLCNLNPLSSNASRAPQGLPTLSEYYSLVLEEAKCTECHGENDSLEEVETFTQGLLSLEGYYRYIGHENASRLGHIIDNMILSCHIYIADGVNKRKVPCRNDVRFSYFQTSLYFNCINLLIGPSLTNTGMVGLSLVLFLDNLLEDTGVEYNQWAEVGLRAGAVLGIQGHHSLPIITTNTIELPPGHRADICITPQKNCRLPPPHGGCTPVMRESLQGMGPAGITLPFRYTYPSCLLTCLEIHVLEECGCVSGRDADLNQYQNQTQHQNISSMKYQNISTMEYCGSVQSGWRNALRTSSCSHRVRNSSLKTCLKACPSPCIEYDYTLSLSQSQWPIQSRMVGFYKHFIKDKPFAHHFSIFENMSNDAEAGQLKYTDPRYAVATELIRNNFLEVSIVIKDYRFISLSENVKTSLVALISQLGGTLNLWSGITAVIIIEILELFYRLFVFVRSKRKVEEVTEKPV